MSVPVDLVQQVLGTHAPASEALVRAWTRAANARDATALEALVDPAVEAPCFRRGRGPEAIRAGMEALWQAVPGAVHHPVEVATTTRRHWIVVDFAPGSTGDFVPHGALVLGESGGRVSFLDAPADDAFRALVRHRMAR